MSTQVSEEVREALHEGRPVVALESTIIAHGLPRPRNLAVALELEELVRAGGAVPATIAVVDGTARVGLDRAALTRIAEDPAVRKLGHRDLAPALATGVTGATTVSATAWLADAAGDTGVRDRGPRRGAPGVDRHPGRIRRSAAARPGRDHRGVRRGQVDPRRARDAPASGDARRDGRRVRHGPLPRLLSRLLGRARRLDAADPGGGGRGDTGPGPARRAAGGADRGQPGAAGGAAGSRPARPGARGRPDGGEGEGRHRAGGDTVPPRISDGAHGRGVPGGQPGGGTGQCAARGEDRGGVRGGGGAHRLPAHGSGSASGSEAPYGAGGR